MNRRLSILFALISVLLGIALISACKPGSRSQAIQPLTATIDTTASIAPVTSTADKPPLCQFSSQSAVEEPIDSLDRYVFAEPSVILTSSTPTISLGIVQWLPDSQNLLITRKSANTGEQTIEVFNVVTGDTRVYAHQQNGSGGFWVPDHQAVIYYERVPVNSAHGVWRVEYWASFGNPSEPMHLVDDLSNVVQIDADSQSVFRWRSANKELAPTGNLSQVLMLQDLPFDLEQWKDSKASEGSASENAWFNIAKQPSGTLIALYDGPQLFLLETSTNQSCEIELGIPVRITSAEWSQDGRYLAMKTASDLPGQSFSSAGLTVLDATTGHFYTPEIGKELVRQVSWVPQSHDLLVTTDKRQPDGHFGTQVQLVNFIHETTRVLVDDGKWNQFNAGPNPLWSPDGQSLAIGCPQLSATGDLVAARLCRISVDQYQ
jgi:hypothetical protein